MPSDRAPLIEYRQDKSGLIAGIQRSSIQLAKHELLHVGLFTWRPDSPAKHSDRRERLAFCTNDVGKPANRREERVDALSAPPWR
jgi:hypothetical protein